MGVQSFNSLKSEILADLQAGHKASMYSGSNYSLKAASASHAAGHWPVQAALKEYIFGTEIQSSFIASLW